MRKRAILGAIGLLVLFFTVVFHIVYGGPLNISLTASKSSYELGEDVLVNGTLTLNDSPVSDGLVAIQVVDPKNKTFVLRTRPTGSDIVDQWPLEILDFIPCDMGGNQTDSFPRGGCAGFKVTIMNNGANTQDVVIILNLYYKNGIPFEAFTMWNHSIPGGEYRVIGYWPVEIPDDAPLGRATVYANLLTDLPEKAGFAYCPEKSTSFTITSGSTTTTASETNIQSASDPGTFNITFRISDHGGTIGNYTVYASCFYEPWLTTKSTTFEAILLGDLNDDYWVDISDLAIVARAYGSYPGHEYWNPIADVDEPWDFIDISDVTFIARRYGHYGTE